MILNTFLFLAQAAPTSGATKAPDPGLNMMVMMMFAFALIYFITIRPQQKRQREALAQIAATKTGDRVVTSGGIHGIISNVKETTFIVKIAENVKIEVEKSAIARLVKASESVATDSKS
ncbi:MAG: preprotein translocase subunit YajC [Verrucomicrobiota bacterium]